MRRPVSATGALLLVSFLIAVKPTSPSDEGGDGIVDNLCTSGEPTAAEHIQIPSDYDVFNLRDDNHDGRITRDEFGTSGRGHVAGGTDEAFACLDTDMNGYITKEERDALKMRFFRSKLSMLNEEEVVDWLLYQKCVPTDLSAYAKTIRAAKLNGLALWDVGVRNTALLRTELHINSAITRRTIVQAICREIEGLGCLGPAISTDVWIPGHGGAKGASEGDGSTASSGMDSFFNIPTQGGRDWNADGQVSKAEFERDQAASGGVGVNMAFSCLDPDDNGQITREEMFELRARFYRSKLSHLGPEEVVAWLLDRSCVPVDMSSHVEKFQQLEINGLSLWEYGVKNPRRLLSSLGIDSEIKRATLTQAICREIEDSGCLKHKQTLPPPPPPQESWVESWLLRITFGFSVALSVLCPLFRAQRTREIIKGVKTRMQKGLRTQPASSRSPAAGDGAPSLESPRNRRSMTLNASKPPAIHPFQKSASMPRIESGGGTTRVATAASTLQSAAASRLLKIHGAATSSFTNLKVGVGAAKAVRRQSTEDGGGERGRAAARGEGARPRRSISVEGIGLARELSGRSDGGSDVFEQDTQSSMRKQRSNRPQGEEDGESGAKTKSERKIAASTSGRKIESPRNGPSRLITVLSHTSATTTNSNDSVYSEESGQSDGDANVRKFCSHCEKPFSKNMLLRKFERHHCKDCNLYFCAAHKKRSYHGCKGVTVSKNRPTTWPAGMVIMDEMSTAASTTSR